MNSLQKYSSVGLLLLTCCCGPSFSKDQQPSGPQPQVEVLDLFTGLGALNPQLSLHSPKALLVVARDAVELTDVVQAESGRWTIWTHSFRLAPVFDQTTLGILGSRGKAVVQLPKWGSERKPFETELVGAVPIQGERNRNWFLALVHEDKRIPKNYRITKLEIAGTTLKVNIEGRPKYEWIDVEVAASPTFLHLVVAMIKPAPEPEFWPECVEVYTNGKRGYPNVPLRIRLGNEFLKEPEPVLKVEEEK